MPRPRIRPFTLFRVIALVVIVVAYVRLQISDGDLRAQLDQAAAKRREAVKRSEAATADPQRRLELWRTGELASIHAEVQRAYDPEIAIGQRLSKVRRFSAYWLWAFVGLQVAGLVPVVARAWAARRKARLEAAGRCGACGYDLRGSADRCPECGNVAPRFGPPSRVAAERTGYPDGPR